MATPRPRGFSAWRALSLLLLLLVAACGGSEPGPLAATPVQLRTTPDRPIATLELHNPSDQSQSISKIHLGGKDWDGFVILGDTLPSRVPAGGSVSIRLRADPNSFRQRDAAGDFVAYTTATAEVRYADPQGKRVVPVSFDAPSQWSAQLLASIAAALLLCGAAWLALRRPCPSASQANAEIPARALAAAVAAAVLAFAFVPFGDALCFEELGRLSSESAVAQCRDGLGGTPLQVALVPGSLLLWLVVMAFGTLPLLHGRPGARSTVPLESTSLDLARVLVVLIVLAPLALAGGTLDVHELASQQIGELETVAVPAWWVFSQPLGLALLVGCAALESASADESRADGSQLECAVRRLRHHAWSAMGAALYLGAWSIPKWQGHGEVNHATLLLLGTLAFALKWAFMSGVISRGSKRNWFVETASSRDQVRIVFRWLIPLALMNLFASVLID
jgi:hypothetical protein